MHVWPGSALVASVAGDVDGDSQYVEFDGKAVVPTLVRIDGNSEYFGYDAQPDRVGSVLYSDFKMNRESAWQDKRETAEMLTEKFLGYMYRQYADQDSYFGSCDTVRTLISYPAKWRVFFLQNGRTFF